MTVVILPLLQTPVILSRVIVMILSAILSMTCKQATLSGSVLIPGNNNGIIDTYEPGISADGGYIAFVAGTLNLVRSGIYNSTNIFVRDLNTNTVTICSLPFDGWIPSYNVLDPNGNQSNGSSYQPSISNDGRYVAFTSDYSNLVPDDTNGCSDVFVYDMQRNITTRVSVDSNGNQSNGNSFEPSISADGRYVAFTSDATNLVPDDTNGDADIFVHDMQTNTTTRISVDSNGTQSDSNSYEASISGDGRYVAFTSVATNLVADGASNIGIFVHDMQTNTTTRVSVDSNGNQGNGDSHEPSISDDGRYVTFLSDATNLVPDDTNNSTDIFVYDTQTNVTTRVSVDSDGNQGNSGSYQPKISADGRYVVFQSDATNLVPGDNNNKTDIFIHDLQTGTTTMIGLQPEWQP